MILVNKLSINHNLSNTLEHQMFKPGIMELSYQGTYVHRNERNMGGTFIPWNFRSQEPSFPGTYRLWTIINGAACRRPLISAASIPAQGCDGSSNV